MIKNIQGISRIPYNRPLYEISFKTQYNLFTPLATNDIPGMASFNSDYFSVINGIVNFKADNTIQIKDYTKWKNDYKEGDDLICPSTINGKQFVIGTPNILWQNGYTASIKVNDKSYEIMGNVLVIHGTRENGVLVQKEIFFPLNRYSFGSTEIKEPYLPSRIYIRTASKHFVEYDGEFETEFLPVVDMSAAAAFKSDYYYGDDRDDFGYSIGFINDKLAPDFIDYTNTSLAPINTKIDDIENNLMTIDAKTAENDADISIINNKIPAVASAQNQLADKAFVNSSINNMASFYITADAQGNGFLSRQQLIDADTYFHGLSPRIPTQNDYAIVLNDETHDNKTARYSYQGVYGSTGEWTFQYTIGGTGQSEGGGTAFTQAQLDAINSGVTAELIENITSSLHTIESKLEENVNTLKQIETILSTDVWKKSSLTFELQDGNLKINVK